jgi:Fur family ferric uptake transcriptional regulator
MRERYNTRHKELLLSFLEERKGQHVSTKDICAHFADPEIFISEATVYRLLKQFLEEGLVNKYVIDDKTPACYEYLDHRECDETDCFHFKCEKCGRLLHLHCDELSGVKDHLFKEHHLMLDSMRTVFYGLCEECRK